MDLPLTTVYLFTGSCKHGLDNPSPQLLFDTRARVCCRGQSRYRFSLLDLQHELVTPARRGVGKVTPYYLVTGVKHGDGWVPPSREALLRIGAQCVMVQQQAEERTAMGKRTFGAPAPAQPETSTGVQAFWMPRAYYSNALQHAQHQTAVTAPALFAARPLGVHMSMQAGAMAGATAAARATYAAQTPTIGPPFKSLGGPAPAEVTTTAGVSALHNQQSAALAAPTEAAVASTSAQRAVASMAGRSTPAEANAATRARVLPDASLPPARSLQPPAPSHSPPPGPAAAGPCAEPVGGFPRLVYLAHRELTVASLGVFTGKGRWLTLMRQLGSGGFATVYEAWEVPSPAANPAEATAKYALKVAKTWKELSHADREQHRQAWKQHSGMLGDKHLAQRMYEQQATEMQLKECKLLTKLSGVEHVVQCHGWGTCIQTLEQVQDHLQQRQQQEAQQQHAVQDERQQQRQPQQAQQEGQQQQEQQQQQQRRKKPPRSIWEEGEPAVLLQLAPLGSARDMYLRDGGFRVNVAQRLVRHAAIGLAASQRHASAIHRDVKAANLLLFKRPDGLHALLCDFGVAKEVKWVGDAGTTVGVGTDTHRAPEVADACSLHTERVDCYSLGATFLELCYGTLPFVYLNAADPEEAARRACPVQELDDARSPYHSLPAAAKAFVRLCFEPGFRRPTVHALLQSGFLAETHGK